MKPSKSKTLLSGAVAGILSATVLASISAAAGENPVDKWKDVPDGASMPLCYGINSCKGMGACAAGHACGTEKHACGGKNACKGQGFLRVPASVCTHIQGGSLKPLNAEAKTKDDDDK